VAGGRLCVPAAIRFTMGVVGLLRLFNNWFLSWYWNQGRYALLTSAYLYRILLPGMRIFKVGLEQLQMKSKPLCEFGVRFYIGVFFLYLFTPLIINGTGNIQ